MERNEIQSEKVEDCEFGYRGDCCCNCINQFPIYKSPTNKDAGKGSILDQMGWVCSINLDEKHYHIFSDKIHGMCELHTRKTLNK